MVLTGHDEYWTHRIRSNLERYVEGGGKLLIFAGPVAFMLGGVALEGYWPPIDELLRAAMPSGPSVAMWIASGLSLSSFVRTALPGNSARRISG